MPKPSASPNTVPLSTYRLTYYHPPRGWQTGDAPTKIRNAAMRLKFRESAGRIDAYMPQGGIVDLARWTDWEKQHAAHAAHAATILCQRARNHPADHGFTWHVIAQVGKHTKFPSVPIAKRNNPVTIDECESRDDRGWFPPGSDPTQFGALYLYPAATPWLNVVVSWQLRHVGLPEPVATAQWDDDEACARLRAATLNLDLRDALLAKAATGYTEDAFARLRQNAFARQATIVAHETFSRARDRIKPQLITSAAETTTRLMRATWRDVIDASGRNKVPQTHGRALPRHWLTSAEKRPPCNIGATIRFPGLRPLTPLPVDHFDAWAARLAGHLRNANLGQLFRYQQAPPGKPPETPPMPGDYTFVVVTNPDLAFLYPKVLSIPDGTLLQRCTVNETGAVVYEPAFTIDYRECRHI